MDFFCIFVLKITNNREKMNKKTNQVIQLLKKHFNKVEDVSYSNDDSEEKQIIYKIIDKLNK